MKNEDTLRFAVVEDETPLTSVWRAWKWRSDVYVAPRSLAGSYKISLHESGRYRFGFVSDQKASGYVNAGDDRAVFKWQRPEPIGPGASLMLQIIFPEPCMLPAKGKTKLPRDLFTVLRPRKGNATTVSLIWALPAAELNQINFGSHQAALISKWDLPNEHKVYIVQHEEVMGADFEEQLNAFRLSLPKVAASIPPEKLPDHRNSHLRSFVSLHRDDGVVRFVDVDAEHIRNSI